MPSRRARIERVDEDRIRLVFGRPLDAEVPPPTGWVAPLQVLKMHAMPVCTQHTAAKPSDCIGSLSILLMPLQSLVEHNTYIRTYVCMYIQGGLLSKAVGRGMQPAEALGDQQGVLPH